MRFNELCLKLEALHRSTSQKNASFDALHSVAKKGSKDFS